MNVNTYRAVIEGVLFLVGDEGCGVKEMAAILELSVKETEAMMQDMMEQFEADEQKGLMIVYLGGKYKLATKTQFKPYFEKMVSQAEASLSNAALETLAIIAYNQPVTRTKIEEIRGVSSDAMVRKLQAKALIKEVGREDTPGKPILYGVSEEFMDAFNLASLDELPDLQNIAQTSMEEDLFDAKYREEDDKADESAG
ncbi:MAG: SMC-Scp complex subunit ScpB [Beduini sp.]|uniref:SMC-Scp complex subunit ScpB n=1 Tax=Beduini sp. TaxID=1922300 RepID=UPI0039A16165